ncbi:HAAS signaling domain-containing protein [Kribbella sp. NPDC055071]
MNVQHDGQQLVDAYLEYLTKAAEPLPAERRTELVAEVTSHIAEARAAGATSDREVQQVLRQLGDPDDIVAAATDGLVLVEQPPRLRLRDFAALALLLFGPALLVIGWVAGVVLLWTSDRWTRGEKLLGILAWPFSYAAAVAGEMLFQPQIWMDMVGAAVIAVAVTVVLAKNARPGRAA